MTQEQTTSKFTSSYNKGFTMGFNNGLIISVQWGVGNYCERRSYTEDFLSEMKQRVVQSGTAEIAIWDQDGTGFNFGSDEVKGWCDTNEVATWIQLVSTATDLEDLYQKATEARAVMPA
jgi:hypothetical protein